jgi:hypothetical protein
MITLFEQKQLPHKFALAISRGETNSSDAGIFIIGGLPDLLDPRINATNGFADVALLATIDFLTTTIAWYAITVESLITALLETCSYIPRLGITLLTAVHQP